MIIQVELADTRNENFKITWQNNNGTKTKTFLVKRDLSNFPEKYI